MTEYANQVIPSLPTPLSGNGLFSVKTVVPDGSFNPVGSNPSTSYSNVIMSPANIIGTPNAPYMNVGLPAYISTLYTNAYNVNNNLQNDISEAALDDRHYPTSFAVQQYVQSQIAGTQIISGANDTYTVLSTVNNTLIKETPVSAQAFYYAYNGVATPSISLFWMDTTANGPRNGATKTVMFGESGYFRDGSGVTGNLAFLYAGDNSYFVNHGVQLKYYQFVYTGDFLTFIQAYNEATQTWNWLVTASMADFSNVVTVKNASGNTATVTRVANSNMPLPIENSFGGL